MISVRQSVGLPSFTQREKLAVEPIEDQEIGGLENYSFLTPGLRMERPNVYADPEKQIVKRFSNMP